VWNRSRERAEPLADVATVADDPAAAVRGADVVVTMLWDADSVESVVQEAVPGLAAGTLWLQTTTVGVDGARRLAGLARKHGLEFVDAPVLGTKQPAENKELIVLASGPDDARDRVAPLLDAVGKKTLWIGEAGAGSRLKVVTNAWIVTVVEGAAETIALAEGLDLDPQLFLEAVGGGPLDLPYLQMKGKAMIEGDFEPSFRLALAAKDAVLVEDAAARAALDLPMLAAIRQRFAEGVEQHGDEDLAATYLTSTRTGATA
jgi:3-hydroxyisobutyrate dehydrogenase